MTLTQEDIEKIEGFMEDESFQTVDDFLACHKRLKEFAVDVYDKVTDLESSGDLD